MSLRTEKTYQVRSQSLGGRVSISRWVRGRAAQILTANHSGTDSVPNLEIDLEVRSELDNFPRRVAPDVSIRRGVQPVG